MGRKTVYFEIFGKKMKHTLYAYSDDDAKYKIIGKINFIKIQDEDDPRNNSVNDIFDLFKGFDKK